MKRIGFHSLIAGLLALLAGQAGLRAAATNAAPDFREVYDLIRANATGLSEAELNRAAVEGLLNALGPRASLVTNAARADTSSELPPVSKVNVFEDGIAYLRVVRIGDDVAKGVADAYEKLSATNRLKGIVLDLRYTDGTNYSAAAATADLFVSKAEPLLSAGSGVVSSHAKTNAIALPVAVLVNRSTAGAAEALAAVLRQAGAGLILGGRTAGRTLLTRDFPLKNGGQLRIGTAPVTVGDGTTLPVQGIKPDIDVTVSVEDERAYYADAFRMVKTNGLSGLSATNGAGGTNVTRRTRLNEAELVREHREGLSLDAETAARPPEPPTPVVNDPALARAIDLLKGLAVVRQR